MDSDYILALNMNTTLRYAIIPYIHKVFKNSIKKIGLVWDK